MTELDEEYRAVLGMAGARAAEALSDLAPPGLLAFSWVDSRLSEPGSLSADMLGVTIAMRGAFRGEMGLLLTAPVLAELGRGASLEDALFELGDCVLQAFAAVLANLTGSDLRFEEPRLAPARWLDAPLVLMTLAELRGRPDRVELALRFEDEERLKSLFVAAWRRLL